MRNLNAEITLHYWPSGLLPEIGLYSISGLFFVSFLEKQKRNYYLLKCLKDNIQKLLTMPYDDNSYFCSTQNKNYEIRCSCFPRF